MALRHDLADIGNCRAIAVAGCGPFSSGMAVELPSEEKNFPNFSIFSLTDEDPYDTLSLPLGADCTGCGFGLLSWVGHLGRTTLWAREAERAARAVCFKRSEQRIEKEVLR